MKCFAGLKALSMFILEKLLKVEDESVCWKKEEMFFEKQTYK